MENVASKLHSTIPTVDWSYIEELRLLQIEGEPDFVETMKTMFIEGTPALLKTINENVVASNLEGLRRAAHTLKGNCNSIGAKRMGVLCADLEKIGKREEPDNLIKEIFAELEREFENVRGAFMEKTE